MNLGLYYPGMSVVSVEQLLHLEFFSAITFFIHSPTTWEAHPVLHAIKPAAGAELIQRYIYVLLSVTIKADVLPDGL